MTRRLPTALVVVGVVLAMSTVTWAQDEEHDTKQDFVNPGSENAHFYSLFSLFGGPTIGTLTWDNIDANLALLLVCGTADPLTYAIGAGRVDRMARIEAGIPPLTSCVVAVSALDNAASYWLNVRDSLDSSVDRIEDTEAALLHSEGRALAVLQDAIRTLERQP